MKNAKNGDSNKSIEKKKRSKIIRLDQKDRLIADLEYEKYCNRIRSLSRGMH